MNSLSEKNKEILLHTLGLNYNDTMFRNFFATNNTEDIKSLEEMEKIGLMQLLKEVFGKKVFIATAKGTFTAMQIYNESKPKETKSKKRYKAYLHSESSETFFEWLKNPYWNDYRKRNGCQ